MLSIQRSTFWCVFNPVLLQNKSEFDIPFQFSDGEQHSCFHQLWQQFLQVWHQQSSISCTPPPCLNIWINEHCAHQHIPLSLKVLRMMIMYFCQMWDRALCFFWSSVDLQFLQNIYACCLWHFCPTASIEGSSFVVQLWSGNGIRKSWCKLTQTDHFW